MKQRKTAKEQAQILLNASMYVCMGCALLAILASQWKPLPCSYKRIISREDRGASFFYTFSDATRSWSETAYTPGDTVCILASAGSVK